MSASKASWARHPHTERLLKQTRLNREIAVADLLAACRDSPDARVRAAESKIRVLDQFIEEMRSEDDGADEV